MKRAARNIAAIAAGDVASRGVGFLITIYLARTLGPEGFGLFGIGMALLSHLQLLTSPGMQVVETRNIARVTSQDPERIGGVLIVRTLLSVCALLVCAVIALLFFLHRPETGVLLVCVASVVPMAWYTDWVLQGKEQFPAVSAGRIAGYLAYGGAVVFLVHSTHDILGAPLAFLAGAVVTALVLSLAAFRAVGFPHFRWAPLQWKEILLDNLPVGWAMFMGQMIINLPPIAIGLFLTTADAGQFNAAMKLIFLFLMIDRIINAIFLPAITRTLASRPEEAERIIAVGVRLLIVLGIPVLICGFLLAPVTLDLIFGAAYAPGSGLLRILLLYVVLTLLNSIAVCALVGAGGERVYAGVMTLSTIVLVALLAVLTPLFGPLGTAAAVVFGELVTAILMFRRASAAVRFPHPALLVRPLAAGIVAAAAAWAAAAAGPVAAASAGFVVFAVAGVLLGVVLPADIAYLRGKLI